MKKNLKDLTIEELRQFCVGEALQPYRAQQIFRWIWKRDCHDLSRITTISKDQRSSLGKVATIRSLEQLAVLRSRDRTLKFLFGLEDGNTVETVYIPTKKRKTVCVSTQVGCALKCAICMTGKSGFRRNLLAWEIADQVRSVASHVDDTITNVVMMGMGEPLLNYANVMKAARILNDDLGMNIGARKITVSTAGIIPGILKLAREPMQVKLAVSLNAADDEKREMLMPVNRKYNLGRLMGALEEYHAEKGKRVTFEYVIIKDFNDSPKDAKALAAITREIPCKINIIPYNPIDEGTYSPPSAMRIKRFIEFLYPMAQSVTLRESRGSDIGGACGQLQMRSRAMKNHK